MSSGHRADNGFTVIEMLVALLLLGSCLIGIAALKATRVRSYEGSAQHDRAVMLAEEVSALIQSQRDTAIRLETSIGMVCSEALRSDKPERVAENQLACWQDRVENELPNGSASVVFDAKSSSSSYVITISWSEPSIGAASYVRRIAA